VLGFLAGMDRGKRTHPHRGQVLWDVSQAAMQGVWRVWVQGRWVGGGEEVVVVVVVISSRQIGQVVEARGVGMVGRVERNAEAIFLGCGDDSDG